MPILVLQKYFHISIGSTQTPRHLLETAGCTLWEFHQAAPLLNTRKLLKNTEKWQLAPKLVTQITDVRQWHGLGQKKKTNLETSTMLKNHEVFHKVWQSCAVHEDLEFCIHQVHLSCPIIYPNLSNILVVALLKELNGENTGRHYLKCGATLKDTNSTKRYILFPSSSIPRVWKGSFQEHELTTFSFVLTFF